MEKRKYKKCAFCGEVKAISYFGSEEQENCQLTKATEIAIILRHVKQRFHKFDQSWRSRVAWSSAHDWKSCKPQKGFEGSNPSFSAKNPEA